MVADGTSDHGSRGNGTTDDVTGCRRKEEDKGRTIQDDWVMEFRLRALK